MKTKVSSVFIFLFLLLLQSCYSQSTATHTLLPSNTSSQTITATKNYTLTPYPTLSPKQLTQTAYYPTFAAINQTQEHYMFTSIPSTLEARNVKCKDDFSLELRSEVVRISNDEWTIFTCSPSNIKDWQTPGTVDFGARYTQLVKTDFSRTWTIQHNEFDYSVIDRPDAFIAPYRWTADGKYLYFNPQYYPSGSGYPESIFLYTLINNLYRINLATGEFKLFLSKDQFGALAFSPNDQFLIYSERNTPDVIHVKNIEAEIDLQIKLYEDVVATGAFVWSPDSTKVVFFTGHGKQSDNWQDDLSSVSIFVLTLKDMGVRKVLAKDERIFHPYSCFDKSGWLGNNVWLDENTICLIASNYGLDSWNKFFTFNIRTGEVKFLRKWNDDVPTSTPTP